jgi:hypothetical protein
MHRIGSYSTANPPDCHQSAHYWIAMHVSQLLNLFLRAPQIEIVETTLPEPTGEFASKGQPTRDAQLHGLNYLRGIAYLRFRNQQMYVFGHDYVSDDGKAIANAHQFEDSQYQVAARGSAQQRLAPVAAPRDEMETSRAVITLQAPGHEETLRTYARSCL